VHRVTSRSDVLHRAIPVRRAGSQRGLRLRRRRATRGHARDSVDARRAGAARPGLVTRSQIGRSLAPASSTIAAAERARTDLRLAPFSSPAAHRSHRASASDQRGRGRWRGTRRIVNPPVAVRWRGAHCLGPRGLIAQPRRGSERAPRHAALARSVERRAGVTLVVPLGSDCGEARRRAVETAVSMSRGCNGPAANLSRIAGFVDPTTRPFT